jgi:hypothetical protein
MISQKRTIDRLFYPHTDALADLKSLGLLGKMLAQPQLQVLQAEKPWVIGRQTRSMGTLYP